MPGDVPPKREKRESRKTSPRTRGKTRGKTLAGLPSLAEHSDATRAAALVAFRKHGQVKDACEVSGVSRATWHRWCQEDEAFADAVREAGQDYADALEIRAHARIFDGENPSDRLLELMLKRHRPEKFRDKQDLTVASPEVVERVQHTARLIASKKTWKSDELLAAMEKVWA